MKKTLIFLASVCLLVMTVPQKAQAQDGAGLKFGFRFYGGANYLAGGQVNEGLEGYADYYRAMASYIGFSVSGTYNPVHFGMNFGGDFLLFFNPSMAVALGAAYLGASRESNITFSHPSLGSAAENWKPSASAIPIRLSFFYFPRIGDKLNFYVTAGLGYYLAKAKLMMRENYTGGDWYKTDIDTSSGGIGFHGGLGLEIKIASRFALFIEASGRYASFGGFEGEATYSDSYGWSGTEDGTLYFFKASLVPLGTYQIVAFSDTEPSGFGISDVQEAKVSFSGFAILIGGIIRF